MRRVVSGIFAATFVILVAPASFAAEAQPQIINVPADSHPPVPSWLKVTCLTDADSLVSSPNCPVIKYQGITTWAYSFKDNRLAFALVSYDDKNKIVSIITRNGARYVWNMSVDSGQVTIYGQSSQTVTAALNELGFDLH